MSVFFIPAIPNYFFRNLFSHSTLQCSAFSRGCPLDFKRNESEDDAPAGELESRL
jgi:hypothetical protein